MKNLLTKAFQGITSSLQLLGNMIDQLSTTASSMHGFQEQGRLGQVLSLVHTTESILK